MEPPLIHRITRRDAELALERARADADWLAALRVAYRGRHDVLDALWWVAHPLTATPEGDADPSVGLPGLQRAVFSRAAAESPVTEVVDPDNGRMLLMSETEHELWQLQRQLAEDASCLERAWLAVHPGAPISTDAAGRLEVPAFTEVSHQHPDPSADPDQDTDVVREPPSSDPAEPARRRLVIPVVAGIGLLGAILMLPALPGITADIGGEPAPAPSVTTPANTPHARMDIVTLMADGNVTDPLAVLGRPQTENDQPGESFAGIHQPESFRKLPELVGFLELYLARGRQADSVCLVVIRHDGISQSSCVRESDFAEQAIELGSSGDQYQVGVDMTILSESFSLQANGDFHYEARARAPQLMPDRDTVFPGAEEQFLGS